jgi:hypothetical protein
VTKSTHEDLLPQIQRAKIIEMNDIKRHLVGYVSTANDVDDDDNNMKKYKTQILIFSEVFMTVFHTRFCDKK